MGQYSLLHTHTDRRNRTKHTSDSPYIMQNLPGDSITSSLPNEGWKEMYSPTCRELDSVVFDIWFDSYITGLSDRPNYNKSLTNHRIRMLCLWRRAKQRTTTNGTFSVEKNTRSTSPLHRYRTEQQQQQQRWGRIFFPPVMMRSFNRLVLISGLLENGPLVLLGCFTGERERRWHKFNRGDNDRERERAGGWGSSSNREGGSELTES